MPEAPPERYVGSLQIQRLLPRLLSGLVSQEEEREGTDDREQHRREEERGVAPAHAIYQRLGERDEDRGRQSSHKGEHTYRRPGAPPREPLIYGHVGGFVEGTGHRRADEQGPSCDNLPTLCCPRDRCNAGR